MTFINHKYVFSQNSSYCCFDLKNPSFCSPDQLFSCFRLKYELRKLQNCANLFKFIWNIEYQNCQNLSSSWNFRTELMSRKLLGCFKIGFPLKPFFHFHNLSSTFVIRFGLKKPGVEICSIAGPFFVSYNGRHQPAFENSENPPTFTNSRFVIFRQSIE